MKAYIVVEKNGYDYESKEPYVTKIDSIYLNRCAAQDRVMQINAHKCEIIEMTLR